MLIIVATIPTGIIGVVLKDLIESVSATLIVPGICLLIGSATKRGELKANI